MTVLKASENYIPLHKGELAEILSRDPKLSPAEQDGFRAFCRLVGLLFHLDYFQRLEKLKAAYVPFDPDIETRLLHKIGAAEKQQRQNTLFNDVARLLEEANYRHLNRDEIVAALEKPTAWGLRMDVDFSVFERLAIMVRGDSTEKRPLRRLRKGMLTEEMEVPIHRRVVMLIKLRQSKRLGRQVDTENVYLQLFKNIPKGDIPMLLPGARARMSLLDRGRVMIPLLTGLALTSWQVASDVLLHVSQFVQEFFLFKPAAVWAAASGTIGYGVKSYYNYAQTRQRYNLALTQILFYQNLDTNAGVLYRLLDEAEEQDCREAMLAYYFLWRQAGAEGCTSCELQERVERDLVERAGLTFRFDTRDCLPRLEKLHIVEKVGERYRALPLAQVMEALERNWEERVQKLRPVPA